MLDFTIAAGKAPERVRDALSACTSFDEIAQRGILFHGTCETIEGPLRGGSYDQVFWTATAPSIAQSYIPSSGIKSLYGRKSAHEVDLAIRPAGAPDHANFVTQWALERSGCTMDDLDIEWDLNRAKSWLIPDGWPSYRDFEAHLETLGYALDEEVLWLKTSCAGRREEVLPADHRMSGQLIVILPDPDLEISVPHWNPEDLEFTNHNRLSSFDSMTQAGQHALRMSDKLQSEEMGNVGHESIGLLPEGLARISWMAIPARRHDGPTLDAFLDPMTEEFDLFMRTLSPNWDPAPLRKCA